MDPFEVLGVARDATAEQVEARWRELARRLHPDQSPAADDAERARLTAAMAELNQARHAALAALRRPDTTGAVDPTMARAAATSRSVPQPTPAPPGAAWFVTAIVLGAGLVWGLFLSPADWQQGQTVRIMYVHVPMAWLAMGGYTALAAASIMSLIWRHPLADLFARELSPVGALVTAL